VFALTENGPVQTVNWVIKFLQGPANRNAPVQTENAPVQTDNNPGKTKNTPVSHFTVCAYSFLEYFLKKGTISRQEQRYSSVHQSVK
jgi:hypothetical protein